MESEQAILADAAEIRRDLEYMTARWAELPENAVFELRAFKEGAHPQTGRFAPDWIDEAVDWAERMNGLGFNIYAVRNPIRATVSKNASDDDIIASFFLWADCDDADSAGNVKRFDGPLYSAAVTTGRTPSVRVHTYWQLKEPCFDMAEWRAMQVAIAQHFGSDRTVINPSRIMRLAGTVAYPDKKKQGRGYVSELTTLRTEYPEPREPVTMDQMRRVFNGAPAKPRQGDVFDFDTGPQPLDRERMAVQALSGQEWHHAVIRLVASYVAKGLSDGEIHALTDPLTLAGYTVEETRKEVQTAIDGARKKGWTPEEYASPAAINTHVPDAEDFDAPKRAADLEWFDDITPVLTDSYMVKGVLGQGAMSVVYGPSNSGKTFFALDMAYHIAIGAQWRGFRVAQAAVLYLAAEGGAGVRNRVAALRQAHGALDVPFALKRAGLDLLHDQADLQHVYDLTQAVKSKCGDLPVLIVIDTLSRIMAGGDENSAADMTALIRNIDAIRAATGGHVMLVHHTGKDAARGARGHSSLRAATDTEIEVQNADDEEGGFVRAAMVTKQRDYQGGETFAFILKGSTLGLDQDGDEVTSCTVEAVESDEFIAAKKAKKGIGGNQKLVLEAFDQLVAEGMSSPNPGGVGMPEPGAFQAVKMDDLRAAAMGKFAAEQKRGAWRDAWKALSEDRGILKSSLDLVWRTDRRNKK